MTPSDSTHLARVSPSLPAPRTDQAYRPLVGFALVSNIGTPWIIVLRTRLDPRRLTGGDN